MEKKNLVSGAVKKHVIEINCVIFNFQSDSLKILLVKDLDDNGITQWRLAHDWLNEEKTIFETAADVLKYCIGHDNYYLKQLKAFDFISLSSFTEDISIGYYALVRNIPVDVNNHINQGNMKWVRPDEISCLTSKDSEIVNFCLEELRSTICKTAIGFNLLSEKFTLLEIIHLYEDILGIEINKSNFRRKILKTGLLVDSCEKEQNVSHRAAKFYKLILSGQEQLHSKAIHFHFVYNQQ